MRRWRWVAAAVAPLVAACGARRLDLPVGSGVAWPEFLDGFERARAACRSVTTLTAELTLEGRIEGTRLRARAHVGLARPAAVRLEVLAPFGPPGVVLVARGTSATLFLPRERRILRDAPAQALFEALTGLALDSADLVALVTGCGVAAPEPQDGWRFGDDWAVAVTRDGTRFYWRPLGAPDRIAALQRGSLRIEYGDFRGARPGRIRLEQPTAPEGSTMALDITIRLAQVTVDPPLGPEVFALEVPADAWPLTLDELRQRGPLGGRPPNR